MFFENFLHKFTKGTKSFPTIPSMPNSNTIRVKTNSMFESQYVLIFFVFFGGASRYSHVVKLDHGLMDRDPKNKFLLPIKSWILLIFILLFCSYFYIK